MACFFFHLVLPGDYQVDDVGSVFPDIEAAWLGGWEAAIEIIADMLRGRRDPNGLQFEIADDQGHFPHGTAVLGGSASVRTQLGASGHRFADFAPNPAQPYS